MKKALTALLIILMMLTGVLVYSQLKSDRSASNLPSSTYDLALYDEFLAAQEAEDYVGMNSAYERNMAKTGISFLDEDYDETHDGLIYTYPYSVKSTGGKDPIRGKLYIVSTKVDRDVQSAGENDYFAVDRRDKKDPEFVVMSSYRADTDAVIRQLCQLLLDHESAYPTEWNRTLESLVQEWKIHNLAYSLNYKIDHSADVNLNNADEDTDWLKKAAKIYRRTAEDGESDEL